MLLVPRAGLLTVHASVFEGISVWDPDTGQHLYRMRPAVSGTGLVVRRGPDEDCVLWSATNGRVGFLRWGPLGLRVQQHAEDGIPVIGAGKLAMYGLGRVCCS